METRETYMTERRPTRAEQERRVLAQRYELLKPLDFDSRNRILLAEAAALLYLLGSTPEAGN